MDKFMKAIRTEEEYDAAVAEIEQYFDNEPVPGTSAANRFEVILALIKAFDDEHHVIGLPDPIEAIKFRMEQAGLKAKDMHDTIGPTNRVHEVLNGTRTLTLQMIRRLNAKFGISAECLIARPDVSRKRAPKRFTKMRTRAAAPAMEIPKVVKDLLGTSGKSKGAVKGGHKRGLSKQ